MPPKSVPEAGQRLFFALWPDASVVYALGEAVSRVQGGRLSRPETLHL
ncbi:MAG: RNA 2',3'-cyclic phosphodiesterase, partial [Betaproteobacteria bacterium]|nr:RNA 2',3'-cyclic phosphodiesterase [Betaproteobacteria bacterium]